MNFKLVNVGVVLLALSLCLPVDSAEILSAKITSFKVKPKVCIVEKQGQECELAAQIEWRATEPLDVCLTQQVAQSQQILQCWNQQQSVLQTAELVLQQTTLMSLIDDEQVLLAQEVLQVNTVQPKKQRRRLRSKWSLF